MSKCVCVTACADEIHTNMLNLSAHAARCTLHAARCIEYMVCRVLRATCCTIVCIAFCVLRIAGCMLRDGIHGSDLHDNGAPNHCTTWRMRPCWSEWHMTSIPKRHKQTHHAEVVYRP
jgi:hypothetical protein